MTSKKDPTRPRRYGGAVPGSFMDLAPPSAIAGSEASKPPVKVHTGVRGRPWTNVRALAQAHTVKAVETLLDLLDDPNSCVRFGAGRVLLELGHRKLGAASQQEKKSAMSELKVTIARFNEEKQGGSAT